jgi:hypothetical protein
MAKGLVWLLACLMALAPLASAQTRVYIMEWSINIDLCSIEFLFNAGMDISSLNATKIVIQQNETIGANPNTGEPYGGMAYRLSENSTSYSLDGPSVTLSMGQRDCDGIQAAYTLADNQETSWLINDEGAMLDLSGNKLEELTDGNAIMASGFLDDYTPPYLKSFSLNMNTGVLLLEFNEVVDLSTLDTTKIMLRNNGNGTEYGPSDNYTLSATSVTPLSGLRGNASLVPIELSFTDLNNLKRMKTLGIDENSTYIEFPRTLVKDMVGFVIIGRSSDNALQVKTLTPDTTAPRLEFFSLDTNAGVIRLEFQEAVDIETLDVTQLTICSNRKCAVSHTLSSACTSPSSSVYNIIISVDAADLVAINNNALLAKYTYNTYLSLTENFVKDLAPLGSLVSVANKNRAVSTNNAWKVQKYIRYGLTSYELDINGTCHQSDASLNVAPGPGSTLGEKTVASVYECESSTGYLTLHFNSDLKGEAMDNSTLDVTKIRFMQEQLMQVESKEYYSGGEFYALTAESSFTRSYAGADILVHIGQADLDQIKLRSHMCVSQASTWVDVKSEVIKDMWGDGVTPYVDADVLTPAMQVSSFTKDETAPSLVYYTLNLDTGKMDLIFSETMNVSSVNVSKLVVQAQRLQFMGLAHRLSTDTVNTMPNGNHIELIIATDDLNALKVMRRLAITRSKTFLVIEDGAFADMAGNWLNLIPDGNAMLARAFVADGTQPVLTDNQEMDHTVSVTSWHVDMDKNIITMMFSEPVDATTFVPGGVTLYGDTPGNSYGYVDHDSDATTETVFVQQTGTTSGNEQGVNATHFQLTPSSHVKAATVNDQWRDAGINSVRLEIQLSSEDRNAISVDTKLCVDQRSCWLRLENWTIKDMNGNQVVQIPEWNEQYATLPVNKGGRNDPTLLQYLRCDSYIADKTPPELLSFSLDINNQLLQLHFSEAVDASTLDITGFTFMKESHMRNGLDGMAKFKIDWASMYTLTGQPTPPVGGISDDGGDWIQGDISQQNVNYADVQIHKSRVIDTLTGSPDGIGLVVQIGEIDTNAMKRRMAREHHNHIGQALITERNMTFMIVEPGAVRDMVGLPLVEIKDGAVLGGRPLKASEPFTFDIMEPTLVSFTFDIRTMRLLLKFSEAVDLETFDVTQLTLQENSDGYYTTTDLSLVQAMSPTPIVRLTAEALSTFYQSKGMFGVPTAQILADYETLYGTFDHAPDDWLGVIKSLADAYGGDVPEFEYRVSHFSLTDSKLVQPELACASMIGLEAQQTVRRPYMASHYNCEVRLAGYTDGAGTAGNPHVLYQQGIDIEIQLGKNDTQMLRDKIPLYTSMKHTHIYIGNKTVADFSGNLNIAIETVTALPVHKPDCSACPVGFFLAKQCNELTDRICTPCTICPYDHFANRECKPNHDTECRRCTTCPYEHYASKKCVGDSDSTCKKCTNCGWNEFQSRPCQMGLNRVCQTCDSCSLTMLEKENNQERKCRKSSLTWRKINCCWDSDNNQVKPCKDLGLQEFKISSRDGRRDEVWCTRYDQDKKQCLDVMGGNDNVPVPSYGVEDTNRYYSDVNYNS